MSSSSLQGTLTRLRQSFDSGKTLPIEWRLAQLAEIDRMLRQHEGDFTEALRLDLGKCRFEAVLTEMSFVAAEAKYARKHLRNWMRHTRVRTPMMAQPGRSYIEPEPKGVVLIIAPWNYPMSMVAAPLVGAVAAGNCAVMKPSEVTTHTSAALAGSYSFVNPAVALLVGVALGGELLTGWVFAALPLIGAALAFILYGQALQRWLEKLSPGLQRLLQSRSSRALP